MEHTLAQQTNTIDKYFLNELSLDERQAFEEHMFDCPECAERVRDDFAMISDLKSVLAEPAPVKAPAFQKAANRWKEWFRPMMLAPSFAALALLCVVGYQNTVSIPEMLQPQVLDTTPFVSTTRGAAPQTALVRHGAALFAVNFEVVSPSLPQRYTCEFVSESKVTVATIDCGAHPTSEFTLSVLLPVAKFSTGGYTMILRSSDKQSEFGRYSFQVRNEN